MQLPLNKISAYILMGGQSRRMQSDKSRATLNNSTLTEIIYQEFSNVFENIYLVGKENHFTKYDFIQDSYSIQCPMNGIVTAIEHTTCEFAFVIACDLPLVNLNSINKLYSSINPNSKVILPVVKNKLQPLCAFYNKNVLANFHDAIKKGDYSIMKILDQIDFDKVVIPTEDEGQFLNVNYPKDLRLAEKLLEIRPK